MRAMSRGSKGAIVAALMVHAAPARSGTGYGVSTTTIAIGTTDWCCRAAEVEALDAVENTL
jgi:hypothetical protein